MLTATWELPEQMEQAAAIVSGESGLDGFCPKNGFDNVVILGMGGSAMAGEVAQAVAYNKTAVPLNVVRNYLPPCFIGPTSLVIAVSFSGNTEETLEAVQRSVQAGASLISITTGGKLAKLADRLKAPLIQLPTEIPQPRAGLGAMLVSILLSLKQVGLLDEVEEWILGTVEHLKTKRNRLFNQPSELARRIGSNIPLIYGAEPLGAVAAKRWKAQFNENSKTPAFCSSYPELCHNELAGWGQNGDITRQIITLIQLHSGHEHPQVETRFGLVSDILQETVADIIEVRAEGEDKGELAQLLDLIFIGDLVSVYLAYNLGVDPGPIPVLDEIKVKLQKTATAT